MSGTAAAAAAPSEAPTGTEASAAPVGASTGTLAVDAGATGTGAAGENGTAVPGEPAAPTNPTLLDKPAENAEPAKATEPEKAPEPIDPASYEVELPEGITRDDPMVQAFLAGAAEARLETPAVQAVLAKAAPLVAEALAAPARAWAELNTQWQGEFRADPELGGANFDTSIAVIENAISKFGNDDLRTALQVTGAGNNPHLLRFIHTLAKPHYESTAVGASPAAGSGSRDSAAARLNRLYPSATQAQGAPA